MKKKEISTNMLLINWWLIDRLFDSTLIYKSIFSTMVDDTWEHSTTEKKTSTITTHLDTASLGVNTDSILTNLLCLMPPWKNKNPDQYAKIWSTMHVQIFCKIKRFWFENCKELGGQTICLYKQFHKNGLNSTICNLVKNW